MWSRRADVEGVGEHLLRPREVCGLLGVGYPKPFWLLNTFTLL